MTDIENNMTKCGWCNDVDPEDGGPCRECGRQIAGITKEKKRRENE
jgi:hypothetical protein